MWGWRGAAAAAHRQPSLKRTPMQHMVRRHTASPNLNEHLCSTCSDRRCSNAARATCTQACMRCAGACAAGFKDLYRQTYSQRRRITRAELACGCCCGCMFSLSLCCWCLGSSRILSVSFSDKCLSWPCRSTSMPCRGCGVGERGASEQSMLFAYTIQV